MQCNLNLGAQKALNIIRQYSESFFRHAIILSGSGLSNEMLTTNFFDNNIIFTDFFRLPK